MTSPKEEKRTGPEAPHWEAKSDSPEFGAAQPAFVRDEPGMMASPSQDEIAGGKARRICDVLDQDLHLHGGEVAIGVE
jgi:hypothetical protein